MNETIRMQISAFVDGELPENEAELLLRRLCQDSALRQQAAQYLDIGRIMRSESSVRGVDQLRDRVSAELDERPLEPLTEPLPDGNRRSWKPFAGVAVAAAVAAVGLLALRQAAVDTVSPDALLADQTADGSYTVPPNEAILRQYMLSHGAQSSEMGANGINARWVSLEFSEEVAFDPEADAEETQGDESPVEP